MWPSFLWCMCWGGFSIDHSGRRAFSEQGNGFVFEINSPVLLSISVVFCFSQLDSQFQLNREASKPPNTRKHYIVCVSGLAKFFSFRLWVFWFFCASRYIIAIATTPKCNVLSTGVDSVPTVLHLLQHVSKTQVDSARIISHPIKLSLDLFPEKMLQYTSPHPKSGFTG